MLGIKMLSFERKLQEQTWSVYYSFKDSLKIINWCNNDNQMDLVTQRNQQASPEGPANHVCEIWSEIKDIKYNKVPWTETVIEINFCQKWGEGAKTSIFFVTNEQLKLHVQCWYCHNLLVTNLRKKNPNHDSRKLKFAIFENFTNNGESTRVINEGSRE
jgi:hypothetical protein